MAKPKLTGQRCPRCRLIIPIADYAEHKEMEAAQIPMFDIEPLPPRSKPRRGKQWDY